MNYCLSISCCNLVSLQVEDSIQYFLGEVSQGIAIPRNSLILFDADLKYIETNTYMGCKKNTQVYGDKLPITFTSVDLLRPKVEALHQISKLCWREVNDKECTETFIVFQMDLLSVFSKMNLSPIQSTKKHELCPKYSHQFLPPFSSPTICPSPSNPCSGFSYLDITVHQDACYITGAHRECFWSGRFFRYRSRRTSATDTTSTKWAEGGTGRPVERCTMEVGPIKSK